LSSFNLFKSLKRKDWFGLVMARMMTYGLRTLCGSFTKRCPSGPTPLSLACPTSVLTFTHPESTMTQMRTNCHRASITRIHRSVYTKPYKTMLCLQDGSTITVRTREPLKIMVMCDDLKTMDPDQKEARFRKRKRQDQEIVADEFDDDFDFGEYVK